MSQPLYTGLIKIHSSKLQKSAQSWRVKAMSLSQCDFVSSFETSICIKFPKNTISAELIENRWFWLVLVPKFELLLRKYYKVYYSDDDYIIGRFAGLTDTHLKWHSPYYRKSKSKESLENKCHSDINFMRLRLATREEVNSTVKKTILSL